MRAEMKASAARVKQIYSGALPAAYGDHGWLPHRMVRAAAWRVGRKVYDFETQSRAAIRAARIAPGDRVLVLCCGTGREFAAIQERIGPQGSILGIDFSAAMLAHAREGVEHERWTNVELVEADVTEFKTPGETRFDVGICTLGISLLSDWAKAYGTLLAAVKEGGIVVIGDLQLASGWRAILNPLVAWWAGPYGGSRAGHGNARALFARMERELEPVETRSIALGTYKYSVARKPEG